MPDFNLIYSKYAREFYNSERVLVRPAGFILSNCVYRFLLLIPLARTRCVFAENQDKCYGRYFSQEKWEAICVKEFIFWVENGKSQGFRAEFSPNEIWNVEGFLQLSFSLVKINCLWFILGTDADGMKAFSNMQKYSEYYKLAKDFLKDLLHLILLGPKVWNQKSYRTFSKFSSELLNVVLTTWGCRSCLFLWNSM